MTRLHLHGRSVYADGTAPRPGQAAPRFVLTSTQLADVPLEHCRQRCLVLLILPSLELPMCAEAARRYQTLLRPLAGVALLIVSPDLPFARHPGGVDTGGEHCAVLSTFRSPAFARAYGVDLVSGPLKGLLAPAVFVLDARRRIAHAEVVRELSRAPDHDAALGAVRAVCGRLADPSVASTDVATVAS